MSIISNNAFSYIDNKAKTGVKSLALNSYRIANIHEESFEDFKIFFENHKYQAKYILELNFNEIDDEDFLFEVLANCIQLRKLTCLQPSKQITGFTYDNLIDLEIHRATSNYTFPRKLQKLTIHSKEEQFIVNFESLPYLKELHCYGCGLDLRQCENTKLKILDIRESGHKLDIDGPLEFLEEFSCLTEVDPEIYDDLFASMFLRSIYIDTLFFEHMFEIKYLENLRVRSIISERIGPEKLVITRDVNLSKFFPLLKYLDVGDTNAGLFSNHKLEKVVTKIYTRKIRGIKTAEMRVYENMRNEDEYVFDFENCDGVYFTEFFDDLSKKYSYKFKKDSVVRIKRLIPVNGEFCESLRESSKLLKYGYSKSFDGSAFDRTLLDSQNVRIEIGTENLEKINYKGNEIYIDTNRLAKSKNKIFVMTIVNEKVTDDFHCADEYYEFINCLITKTSGFSRSTFINCTFKVPLNDKLISGQFFEAVNCDFIQGINNFHFNMIQVYLRDCLVKDEFVMNREGLFQRRLHITSNKLATRCYVNVDDDLWDTSDWFLDPTTGRNG